MNSNRKGSAGERELLKLLRGFGFSDATRNDQRYVGGEGNPDISLTFRGIPIHIEVKRREKLRLFDAVIQATTDADISAFPVVVHRSSRQPWLVTFTLADFFRFAQPKTNPANEAGEEAGEEQEEAADE